MLTLDDAINKFEAAAIGLSGTECGIYNSQIASFLKELKCFRSKYPDDSPNPYLDCNPYTYIRDSDKISPNPLGKSKFHKIQFSKQ